MQLAQDMPDIGAKILRALTVRLDAFLKIKLCSVDAKHMPNCAMEHEVKSPSVIALLVSCISPASLSDLGHWRGAGVLVDLSRVQIHT